MLAQEIIRCKRDGHRLQRPHIDAFVRGLVDGSWSEGQAAAMAMAMFLQGMTNQETIDLTQAMTRSGLMMDWTGADLPGPILDKHSTGGVGDKVSLMLAPIVAACGGFVPMISGRGLGHTGGTLDKLASIPGYQSTPDTQRLRRALKSAGCVIMGQTAELAPADRRLYAIRDVTATVESVALITASILSKKLAAGLQALVMDVKTGNGAFAASFAMADELASSLVQVANGAGLPTRAWITDMNQVLGDTCGNAVEVSEALAFFARPTARAAPAGSNSHVERGTAGDGAFGKRPKRRPAPCGHRTEQWPCNGALWPHGGRAWRAERLCGTLQPLPALRAGAPAGQGDAQWLGQRHGNA